ncbi:9886_t:CDS:1, partial [Cetraspora pellucida]
IIVGGGWYGCHVALVLRRMDFEVTILEKNDEIFDEISGNFGIRNHVGLHYLRSEFTQKACLEG